LTASKLPSEPKIEAADAAPGTHDAANASDDNIFTKHIAVLPAKISRSANSHQLGLSEPPNRSLRLVKFHRESTIATSIFALPAKALSLDRRL